MIAASFILPNLQGDPTRSPVKTASARDLTYSRGYYPVRALPGGLGNAPAATSAEERQLEIMEEQLKISRVSSKITIVLAVLTIGYGAFTVYQMATAKKKRPYRYRGTTP